jgi:hypothetical protein
MSDEVRTPINAMVGYAELLDAELGGTLTDAQDLLSRLVSSRSTRATRRTVSPTARPVTPVRRPRQTGPPARVPPPDVRPERESAGRPLDEGATDGAAAGPAGGGGGMPNVGPADARRALLVAELRERLRPACRDWGEADFETLVQRIAG